MYEFRKHWRLSRQTLFLALVFGSAFGHEGAADQAASAMVLSPDQESVAQTLDAYATSYAATDLEEIRRLVVSDSKFSFFEGSSPDWSWHEFSEHAGAEMPSFSNASYVLKNVRPEIHGDMAFATFIWVMDVVILSNSFPDGRHPVSMKGLGTAILFRIDGKWKIRHIHTGREQSAAEK